MAVFTVTAFLSCSPQKANQENDETDMETPETEMARASIQSASGSSLTGEATFEETAGGTKMTLVVRNAPPGTHAIHLHQNGDCSAADASSAGGHWNPTDEPHGKRAEGEEFHRGDVANLEVGQDSTGRMEMTIENWTIGGPDKANILNKAVIIHADPDDFVSQPSGNAGARIGCGVIQKVDQAVQ